MYLWNEVAAIDYFGWTHLNLLRLMGIRTRVLIVYTYISLLCWGEVYAVRTHNCNINRFDSLCGCQCHGIDQHIFCELKTNRATICLWTIYFEYPYTRNWASRSRNLRYFHIRAFCNKKNPNCIPFGSVLFSVAKLILIFFAVSFSHNNFATKYSQ